MNPARSSVPAPRSVRKLRPSWFLLLLCLSACAVHPEAGFPEVERMVGERGVARVHWNRGTEADAEVERHVEELLGQGLTVASATEVALLHNPRLQATYERLGVAQADLVQAGLLRNPTLSVGVGIPLGAGQVAWDVGLVQGFLDLFVMPLRRRFAKSELLRVQLEVGDEVLGVAGEARDAFYGAQASQQITALWRAIDEGARAGAEVARAQRAAGNISELDAAEIEGQAGETRLSLLRAQAQAVVDRERLTRVLGVWGRASEWRLAGSLPELPAREVSTEQAERFALEHRLDLAALRREAETAQAALRLTRGTRVISALGLGAAAARDPEGHTTVGPRLDLELPIFDQKQAQVARLMAEARAAVMRSEALAVAVRSEVRVAANRVATARALALQLRTTLLPLRERIVELSQQQYNAMLLGVYQLLAARRAEVGAWRDYIEAVRDYWIARSDLERAAGGPLPEAALNANGAAP